MKILKCKFCRGEVNIIGNKDPVNKIVKCISCGFTNEEVKPEVIVMYKRQPA